MQYKNPAAADGLGARVDVPRDLLDQMIRKCEVDGRAVEMESSPGRQPGAAKTDDGKPRDASRRDSGAQRTDRPVQAAQEPATSTATTLTDGRYTCSGFVGRTRMNFGFVEIRGGTYRGASLNLSNAFAPYHVGADGSIEGSKGFGEFNNAGVHYRSARIVAGSNTRFQVTYALPSGRTDGVDCGRE